jgi:hypothetical protein
MTIKRYKDMPYEMVEDESGNYVRFEDVEKLLNWCATARAHLFLFSKVTETIPKFLGDYPFPISADTVPQGSVSSETSHTCPASHV